MSDFPDPDEEFELLYGDDLEVLQEREFEPQLSPVPEIGNKSRRSLDFSSPAVRKTFGSQSQNESNKEKVSNVENVQGNQHKDFPATGENKISAMEDFNESGIKELPFSQSQKRNLDDLFGDLDDLCFEDDDWNPKTKKMKADKDEQDDALIEKIIEMRRMKHQSGLPAALLARNYNQHSLKNFGRDKLSFTVPDWPFISVTRSDGYKIYVGFRDDDYKDRVEDTGGHEYKNLLGSSFQNVWREARLYLEKKVNKSVAPSDVRESLEMREEDEELWVQRYRPRTYLELLSDESTNRTMLYWLKMWDKVVFNREVKVRQPEVKSSFNKRSGKFEFGMGKRNKVLETELESPMDEHGRPRKLLALLCGPPGSGKTTLAHLLARHAGYKVVEINASDDRNVESFKTALENATQMKSVLDAEKRPNCLILDEIDGAPLPAIEYLIKFISGALAAKAKKGEKVKVNVLRRPIICICNDPYAPALRPLRQVAMVLHLSPPIASRLGERLAEVALREGLLPDPPLLAALGERTNRDVRACLTILHFCKLKGKQLKLADLQADKINIGIKDSNKSQFQVWQEVFQAQGDEAGRARRLLHTVMSAGDGDYDRLVSGVYENYLDMKMRDSRLLGVCLAMDWFVMHDMFSSFINSTQNYILMGYLPYSFLSWHYTFASRSWPNVKYPSVGFQMYQKQNQFAGVVSGVQRSVCPQVKPYCSRSSLLLDLLPFLPHIISPLLRPVNIQLYTEGERRSLASLIGVMIDYNLQYTQQRLADGNYHYLLDPDITAVGVFDEKTANVRNLTYSMKQLIAREVDLEKIRRTEGATVKKGDLKGKETKNDSARSKNEDDKNANLPNHLQRLQPKKMKNNAPLVMKDFFGRTITCSPATAAKKAGKTGDFVKSPIWYHYKEGFNNAVRRDVKMSDLL